MPAKSNTEAFIKKAREIHGDKYDYSKVEYKGNRIPVIIICPKHGEFLQTPHEHLSGCGCKKCYMEKAGDIRRKQNKDFIEQLKSVHGDKYDYSKTIYTGANEKIIVTCPKHGDFEINASNHLRGQGCNKCANEKKGLYRKHSNESFIEAAIKIHGKKYDYSKVNYKGSKIPVTITCPEHGDFIQRPNDHLMGHGCPDCAKHFGIAEKTVLQGLREKYGVVSYQYKEKFLHSKTSSKTIDFYLPDYKIGVEYQGAQHFGPNKRFGGEECYEIQHQRDLDKFKVCEENGIKMFYISFEKNVPENYFIIVYRTLDDLLNAIDEYIEQTNKLNEIIENVVASVLNEIHK